MPVIVDSTTGTPISRRYSTVNARSPSQEIVRRHKDILTSNVVQKATRNQQYGMMTKVAPSVYRSNRTLVGRSTFSEKKRSLASSASQKQLNTSK